jgi:hypothetical protein
VLGALDLLAEVEDACLELVLALLELGGGLDQR